MTKNALLLTISCLLLAACHTAPTPTAVQPPTVVATAISAATPSPLPPSPTIQPTETKPVEAAGQMFDDFESPNSAWQAALPPNYPDSSATSVSLTSDYAVQGKQSLALTFEKNSLPQAIFVLEGQFDLSQASYLAFDLIDPDRAVEAVAISLSTGSNWDWYATSPVLPPTDATQITFELKSDTFRTAASDWQPTAALANAGNVKRIAIILIPAASGTVYLDNLRLLPAGVLVSLPPTAEVSNAPTPTPGPCPGQAALPASDFPLAISLPAASTPSRGSLVEFDLQTSVQVANPYDPNEIDLMVHYTAPDGSKFSIPAFWMQNFDLNTEQPCGQAGWKARLNPTQSGTWTAQAEIVNQGVVSEAITFDVVEPAEPPLSFIRLHPTDLRYLATDDGQTFFPIGLNIGWWQDAAIPDYTRWLDHFAPNGGNLIRVWMASWSFGIETKETGLGNYDQRQDRAWMLDQLFQIAAERGVYIDLVILYHGAFSTNVNPEWSLNPYNVDNGGMCADPACFATDEAAKEMFKHRLRYIAARWGYASNLLTWEWWNEYNWTPINDADMAAWIQEMTPYLLQFDPYDHLISTSSATGSHPEVFNLPELDFLYRHLYSPGDPMADFSNQYQQFEFAIKPLKPVVFGEFGYGSEGENQDSYDKTGIHLHNGLWAATFSQFASPAMYWWWDSYIEPLNLWWRLGNLHTFIKDVDLAQYTPIDHRDIELSDAVNGKIMAMQSSENALLAWIRQTKYEASTVQTESEKQVRYQKADPATLEYHLEPLSGLTLTITTLPDGSYTLEWYDPQTGTWQPPVNVSVVGGKLTVDVPAFEFDMALRIQPVR